MSSGVGANETPGQDAPERPRRRKRADAQRNLDALLEAAAAVFATSGVDAPAKEITDKAGLGVGTLYRHFPKRSDLVKAVFQREVDACAEAASVLAAEHEPAVALEQWIQRFTGFLKTKQGLAAALHSGDPAFDDLPDYFMERFEPALSSLLEAAAAAGEIRGDVAAGDLLYAVGNLSLPGPNDGTGYSERMIALLLAGLRRT